MDTVIEEVTSNHSLRKNLFKGPKFNSCIIGLVLIGLGIVAPHLLTWLKSSISKSSTDLIAVIDWLLQHTDKLVLGGMAPLALGISLYIVYIGMHKFWATHVDPHVAAHINKLSAILEKSGQHAQEVIGAHSLELAIRHSEPETVKNALKTAHSRAFGSHCDRPKGLYQAIQDRIGTYLEANAPHRSTNQQQIIIESTPDGKFKWKETTTYNLHTIAYDGDFETPAATNETVTYHFNTSTSAKYTDLDKVELKVSVNRYEIANTKGRLNNLTFDSDGVAILDEGLITITKLDNNEVEIAFEKEIKINQPETKIKIEEISIIEDNYFVARRDQPVCGQTIHIEIPDNYKFDYLAVPPGVEHPEEPDERHRNVKMEGWIMPGIIFSCQWSLKDKN